MVFPLSKLIFIYQPLISLDGISSTQTYIHLPTTYLPRWYFLYPNLNSFTYHLSPSMVFPLSKLIFIYQPLVYLDGIFSTQTYIHLPTTNLPRWYFLYPNLNSFTYHLSPSMVFPLSKLIFICRPLFYLDGISSIQTYIHLPTTYLPRWYFLYPNLYSFVDHYSTSMVFPLSKLIFIYLPLISLDGISSIQTYIHLPTTCLPRWYFLYPNLYSFTYHLSTSMVFPLPKLIFIYLPLIYLDGIFSTQTYIHLPTTYLPRWYFFYTNLY